MRVVSIPHIVTHFPKLQIILYLTFTYYPLPVVKLPDSLYEAGAELILYEGGVKRVKKKS